MAQYGACKQRLYRGFHIDSHHSFPGILIESKGQYKGHTSAWVGQINCAAESAHHAQTGTWMRQDGMRAALAADRLTRGCW